ncbi:hypothetical protein OIU74_011273 [Salix koriyanagi]|uniref:Uncharacterized protein n=1 Tax=Salix koriyanagi TaxID=2511006 RepID=A0A9Q0TEV5_9ROSI|nr:hypothetical protein OIU74_011273 [Salix koriyanagi]
MGQVGRTQRSGVGTFRCHCTTQDTPEPSTRPCRSGNLIACSASMGCQSPEMLSRRGSSPWELFFGPIRPPICVFLFFFNHVIMMRGDQVLLRYATYIPVDLFLDC